MDLGEDAIPGLFGRAGSADNRDTSLTRLMLYEQPALADQAPPAISLEKMWLALHHLLTGEFRLVPHRSLVPSWAGRLSARMSGTVRRDTPGRRRSERSRALASVTHEDLRRRYDPAGLKAAWPSTPVDDQEDEESVFGELESHFQLLVAYYRIAAARGNAMLIGVV